MQLKYILKSISDTYNFKENSNVIFLNTGDILAGKILHNNYSDAKYLPGQAKKSIRNQDILFSEIRPANQRFALVNVENPNDYVVSTKLMVLRCFNPNYTVEYVYNFLTQTTTLNQLQTLAESRSGTFPQITFAEIESLEIPDLSLEEQKHIVDILGSLDNSIENAQKSLELLDSQIHSFFRLFYEGLNDYSTIENECVCLLGGTPKTNNPDFWNGSINWINSGEVNKLRITQASKTITELGLQKSATKMLSKGTTVIAITGATLGQVSLLEIDACANQSVIGIISKKWNKDYIYPLICYHIKDLISKQTGGAQQHINMNDVKSLVIRIPNLEDYKHYSQKTLPLFEKQSNLCKKIKKLNQLKELYLKKFFD